MESGEIWKWKGFRWLYAYLGFWLIAGGVSGCMARMSPQDQASSRHFVFFVIVVIILWCAATDRGNKTPMQKVGWVFALVVVHSVLSLLFLLLLAGAGVVAASTIPRFGNMLAGYVVLYFSLKRSSVFVERVR